MTEQRGQLLEAIEAVHVNSLNRFTWLGRAFRCVPDAVARGLPPGAVRGELVHALGRRLYLDFFTVGRPRPATEDRPPARPDQSWVAALLEANSGVGPWQAGWTVVDEGDDGLVVEREGLGVVAPPERCRGDGRTLCAGAAVDVRLPNALLGRSPGHVVILGDLDWDPTEADAGIRVYWHLSPRIAEPFVRHATVLLNRARTRFWLKVLDDPATYDRADAAVLYMPGTASLADADAISQLHRAVGADLLETVPALTLPVAAGVAVAESPPHGESFGRHRCALVAEALVRAHESGRTTAGDRLASVERAFREAGLEADRPYLGYRPGRSDGPSPASGARG